jgi:hypothetical protein
MHGVVVFCAFSGGTEAIAAPCRVADVARRFFSVTPSYIDVASGAQATLSMSSDVIFRLGCRWAGPFFAN